MVPSPKVGLKPLDAIGYVCPKTGAAPPRGLKSVLELDCPNVVYDYPIVVAPNVGA